MFCIKPSGRENFDTRNLVIIQSGSLPAVYSRWNLKYKKEKVDRLLLICLNAKTNLGLKTNRYLMESHTSAYKQCCGSGSGIRRIFDPSPRSGKGKKSRSGSGMNIPDHNSESLETIFWVKILKFFYADADPGSGNLFDPWSGMGKIWIRDPGKTSQIRNTAYKCASKHSTIVTLYESKNRMARGVGMPGGGGGVMTWHFGIEWFLFQDPFPNPLELVFSIV